MALLGRRILGLAMEERGIIAAEVQLSGRRAELRRAAEFAFPADLSLDDPQALGKALGQFLRAKHFSARTAIVGVPARWLLSKEKAFPSANSSLLAGMIRLEAERSFATNLSDLLLDYSNGRETAYAQANGSHVLVMALSREKADRLTAMALAAGLKLKTLTSTSMVLAVALRPAQPASMMLSVRPGHVEICIRSGGSFRVVKHLPAALPGGTRTPGAAQSAWSSTVADEIRRLTVLLPQDDAGSAPEDLVAWNGANLDPAEFDGLGDQLSLQTELSSGLADLGIVPSSTVEEGDCSAAVAAAALALAGARNGGNGRRMPIDFLHSRLAVHGKTRMGRRVALIAASALIALAAGGFIFADWRRSERELAGLRNELAAMKPDVEDARAIVQRIGLARRWTDQRPRFLEPLRELALAFPSDGIWVTNIAMREDMRSVVSGKSADKQTVLDTLDRIRATETVAGRRAFSNVKLVYMRDAGAGSREIVFSMSFDFAQENEKLQIRN